MDYFLGLLGWAAIMSLAVLWIYSAKPAQPHESEPDGH
jgi:hypothetical protein